MFTKVMFVTIYLVYQYLLCSTKSKTYAWPRHRSKRPQNRILNLPLLFKAQELLSKRHVSFQELQNVLKGQSFRAKEPRFRTAKRRKRHVKINFQRVFVTSAPTNWIVCKIYCKSGFHLQILPDGTVQGTTDPNNKYTQLELQSFGPSLLRIKGIAANAYLTINHTGILRGMHNPSLEDSLFKETHEENAFNSYASYKYFYDRVYDMLIGIRNNGRVKKTWKTFHGQTATQFLVRKLPSRW